jgi:hypothetical protein
LFRSRLAGVAQLVEQLIRNQQVLGSSPSAGSRNCLVHSLLLILNLLIQRLDSGQKPIEIGPAKEPAAGDDGADPPAVGDVRKRIRLEEDEIGQLGPPR